MHILLFSFGAAGLVKSKEQSAVEAVLTPFHPQIVRTILGAWKEHRDQDPTFLLKTSAAHGRTRAAIQWSLMVDHAKTEFDGTGVKVEEKGGTCNFELGGLMFRLKKLDRKGFSRNFATQTALAFYQQIEIDGIPSVLRLDIGYILNTTATSIEEIRVVRREGSKKKWDYVIPLAAASANGARTVPLTPDAPPASVFKLRKSRVKVRNRGDEKSVPDTETA
jgi:hypothetical protein